MPSTHIYFLLDRSGSMASMAGDVIGGFNTFLDEQRHDGDDALMTLVQFDSHDSFEVLADAEPLAVVAALNGSTFQPRGSTPLLDATGALITHASKRVAARKEAGEAPEEILFVTFTDGFENASRRFHREDITRLVAQKEAEGWTFVFLGADPSTYGEAGAVGYDARAVQAFAPDGTGARLAFADLSTSATRHRGRARRGETWDKKDFFEGDKGAEDDRRRRYGDDA